MTTTKQINHHNRELSGQYQAKPGEYAVMIAWKHKCDTLAGCISLGVDASEIVEALVHIATTATRLGMERLPIPPREALRHPVFQNVVIAPLIEMKSDGMPNTTDVDAVSRSMPRVVGTGISGAYSCMTPMIETKRVYPMGFAAAEGLPNQMRRMPMALGQKQTITSKDVGKLPASVVAVVNQKPQSTPTVDKAALLKQMKKNKGVSAATAASGGTPPLDPTMPRATVTAKKSKVKVMTPCLDGCGVLVGGRYAPGHDAKLKSLLLKVERGEVDVSEIPEPAKQWVEVSEPIETKEEVMLADTANPGKMAKHTIVTQNYQILKAPVRFQGRDDVEYVDELTGEWASK